MAKPIPQKKSRLHPRNKNRERYDLEALKVAVPALQQHVHVNKHGNESVNFANPVAVRLLNQALLHYYYGIKHWDFPEENLCPPIPGRADYLHYIADVLAENNFGKIPKGKVITGLDLGVGASCIYPIIGISEYGWQFIGSDIDGKSIASARAIVAKNDALKGKIECRLQKNVTHFFLGILKAQEKIDITICNPPFHASAKEAEEMSRRKVENLSGKAVKSVERNFAGKNSELIYEGGEYAFIKNMIAESEAYAKVCFWFSTLVSKQTHVHPITKLLERTDATQVKTIPMGTGNKSSRIVAWTFLTKEEKKAWREERWKK